MAEISQRELRNDSGEILRRVEAGERLTVTRRGVPIADLVPHVDTGGPAQRWVPAARLDIMFTDLPEWGLVEFDDAQRELDSAVDDELRDPWGADR